MDEDDRKYLERLKRKQATLLTMLAASIALLMYIIYLKNNIHQWPWWWP